MRILAIDPGLRRCGLAIGDTKSLVWCDAIKTDTEHVSSRAVEVMVGRLGRYLATLDADDIDICVVESQVFYGAAAIKSVPQDLIDLGQIAGACLALVSEIAPACLVSPSEWKGTQSKKAPQQRAYRHYGVDFSLSSGKEEYCIPEKGAVDCPDSLKKIDWKEISDAVALLYRVATPGLRSVIQVRAGI